MITKESEIMNEERDDRRKDSGKRKNEDKGRKGKRWMYT